jgi:hypothetical protein
MNDNLKGSLLGLGLMGVGAALAAVGAAVVVSSCAALSRDLLETAFRKGKEGVISGVQGAAATAGEIAGRAQHKFGEAARTAREQAVQ